MGWWNTNSFCPVCTSRLYAQQGHQVNEKDGVTVFCGNRNCAAQEVAGHGDNEKEAVEVIKQKFSHRVE